MGYYDKYLHNYFNKYHSSDVATKIDKALLIGLAFREQIVDEQQLPLDPLDYPLDLVLASD